MKYKLEIWKYNIVNSIDAENHLNTMAAKGWSFWSLLDRLHLICYRKNDSWVQRKKYAVDVFYEDSPNQRWAEEDDYKAFYKELGWDYVEKMGNGLRLFQRPYQDGIPSIHASEREPRDIIALTTKKTRFWPAIVSSMVLVAVLLWWVSRLHFDGRIAIFFGILWALLVIETAAREVVAKAYVKGGDEEKLSRVQGLCSRIPLGVMSISFAASAMISLYYLVGGSISYTEADYGMLPLIQFWSVCALPGFAIGLFMKLILREAVFSLVLLLLSFFGMLFGFIPFLLAG